MAGFEGFAGFDFKPSSQVGQEFQQGLQQALTGGNVDAMRMAVAQQAAFTVAGGSPEFKAARKREKALKDAMAIANKNSAGMDDIEKQTEYYRQVQKAAVENELPDIAMQATDNLSRILLMNEERARIKQKSDDEVAAQEDAREAHDLKIADAKLDNLHVTTGVIIDPVSGDFISEVDLMEPGAKDQIQAAMKEGNTFTTMDNYIDLQEAEKERASKLKSLANKPVIGGRSTLYKDYMKSIKLDNNFVITSDRMVDLLLDPQASATFAAGGSGTGVLQKVSAHARSVLQAINPNVDLVSQVGVDLSRDERFNALSGERQALVMELGYALATAREGGRLTDQDIDRAITSLGLENPDPRAVAYTFGRALKDRRRSISEGLSLSGVKDVEDAQDAQDIVMTNIDSTISRLESQYQLDFSKDTIEEALGGETASPVGADTVDDVVEVTAQGLPIVQVPSQLLER